MPPIPVSEMESKVSQEELQEAGVTVGNLVATLELQQELDLSALAADLDETEYDPEHSPFLVYRPSGKGVSCLVPANGKISIVGAKSKADLINATETFLTQLSSLGIEVQTTPNELELQNVVGQGDFGVDLDLEVITLSLGLEQTEYEPEQFPGVIYRPPTSVTILIFASGTFVITGAKTYEDVLDASKSIREQIRDLGVEGL